MAFTSFAREPVRCHVSRLRLANFRSYGQLAIDLPGGMARPVVLVGANGAGKTNLLEAVSYLAPGRGLRSAKLGDVTRLGSTAPWAVHASLKCGDDRVEIGTGLVPTGSSDPLGDDGEETGAGRRVVRIDGQSSAGPAALGAYVAMLWLTPAMDRLFMDAASNRRRFLDRIVLALHSDHGRQVNAYERAMRERNRLLTHKGPPPDPAWLTALEARMAESAVAIAAARRETLHHLDARLNEAPAGPFPRAQIAVEGWVEDELAMGSALEAEEAFAKHLNHMRQRDAVAGRTLDGPHRSDLLVRHVLKDMPAHLCSTGEQKALLISIVLAHARLTSEQVRRTPILLLDEVAAHLDEQRRAALFEQILTLGVQAWLTGTDRHLFAALAGKADAFYVDDGQLSACQLD